MLIRHSLGVLAVAFVTGVLLGRVPVVGAPVSKSPPIVDDDKQQAKKAADVFAQLSKAKTPSPALLAEARRYASWLKDYSTKNPARVQAAAEKLMASGTLTPAEKARYQQMVKTKGSHAAAVGEMAVQFSRQTAAGSGIRPADFWGDVGKFVGGVIKGIAGGSN
jgi:hypothetical protein